MKNAQDVKSNVALYDRLQKIHTIVQSILELDGVQLYLFGSQVKGVSRSGNPDIDVRLWHESFPHLLTYDVKHSVEVEIVKLPYHVDVQWGVSNLRVF